jgi:hypothetical protein
LVLSPQELTLRWTSARPYPEGKLLTHNKGDLDFLIYTDVGLIQADLYPWKILMSRAGKALVLLADNGVMITCWQKKQWF